MALTLLDLARQVTAEMGLSQPSVLIGTSVNQNVQLLALAQRLLKDLVREYEWRRLVKTHVFQTTEAETVTGDTLLGSVLLSNLSDSGLVIDNWIASGAGIPTNAEIVSQSAADAWNMDVPATATATGVTITFAQQDYALPSDFDRMSGDANWDRTNRWANVGPKSSQEWQLLQGSVIATGPRERYRIYGNKLRFFPAPTAVLNIAYEYVSNFAVIANSDSTPSKAAFTVDNDTCVFPDDLMLAGLKYYFLKAKKLDFGIEMADYAEILATRKGQDQPDRVASLAPMRQSELIGPMNVQEGNWDL